MNSLEDSIEENAMHITIRDVNGNMLLTVSQMYEALGVLLHKVGYAEVLEFIAYNATFDGGDRGLNGFASMHEQKAAFKAFDLISKAADILKATPIHKY